MFAADKTWIGDGLPCSGGGEITEVDGVSCVVAAGSFAPDLDGLAHHGFGIVFVLMVAGHHAHREVRSQGRSGGPEHQRREAHAIAHAHAEPEIPIGSDRRFVPAVGKPGHTAGFTGLFLILRVH